jgi:hypothetical protein
MFITGDLRECIRTPFVKLLRYSLSVLDTMEPKRIYDTAVSIDISKGGLGIITNYPLEAGLVLTFEDEIKINYGTVKSAIVRWTEKINGNKYRAGLKFA